MNEIVVISCRLPFYLANLLSPLPLLVSLVPLILCVSTMMEAMMEKQRLVVIFLLTVCVVQLYFSGSLSAVVFQAEHNILMHP
jgi:hypothetical protein